MMVAHYACGVFAQTEKSVIVPSSVLEYFRSFLVLFPIEGNINYYGSIKNY